MWFSGWCRINVFATLRVLRHHAAVQPHSWGGGYARMHCTSGFGISKFQWGRLMSNDAAMAMLGVGVIFGVLIALIIAVFFLLTLRRTLAEEKERKSVV